ncbi:MULTISPECIES: ATP-dependent DNA ligase [Bacillus]|uniref:ATP-dependent DNA ligase n=1 Tax=Bacillus TaxID=1386 RepID=UPI00398AD245
MERFVSKKLAHKIGYCVFDFIYKDCQSIAAKPLTERKTVLNSLELTSKCLCYRRNSRKRTLAYFALAKEKNLEGIVLKKADSPYEINKHSHN